MLNIEGVTWLSYQGIFEWAFPLRHFSLPIISRNSLSANIFDLMRRFQPYEIDLETLHRSITGQLLSTGTNISQKV